MKKLFQKTYPRAQRNTTSTQHIHEANVAQSSTQHLQEANVSISHKKQKYEKIIPRGQRSTIFHTTSPGG